MTTAPTLIDALYRSTFKKKVEKGWGDKLILRRDLQAARRFVLDDKMSAFLSDLATASFIKKGTTHAKVTNKLIEQLRVSARLPHAAMWVEYDLRANLRRADEILQREPRDYTECPQIEGWLLQQHPTIETAFVASVFSKTEQPQEDGFDTWVLPFTYAWVTDDAVIPWQLLLPHYIKGRFRRHGEREPPQEETDIPTSAILAGLRDYDSQKVGAMFSPYADPRLLMMDADRFVRKVLPLAQEWSGIMRRIWALLATINDIPVLSKDVKAQKGFVARGSYHKFLDHKTITLNVPGHKEMRLVARSIVAAARRRAHMVRGHWRKDHWHAGERVWIKEHVRGDSSLGFVTHDYEVKHDEV